MFYMERGLWESNMKITFNFPQENKLTVEKEVDTTGANDIFKKALADVGTFDFEIKNLATSGETKEVSTPSSPEVKQVFNDYTNQRTISGTGVKNSSVEVVDDFTDNGKGKLISSYYPGEKKSTDTQEKTDSRLVKIQANGAGTFDALDSKGYKYLQFDVYNTDENASGTDPFVALVDEDGTRIGAWASFLTYNGRNNNIDNKIWKTIRIDLNKLKKKTLDEGTTSGFDFSKVKEIQFAYWDDVTVYLDKFAFVKPASVEKTGFTTEQEDIPDYGSIESKKLEPVNGAYYQNTNGDTIIYSDGLLSIGNKESAIFSDQFRRGSYLSIAEKNVSPDVFTTTWSLYENGAIVNPNGLTSTSSTVTGSGQGSVENQSGYEVKDGRTGEDGTTTTITFKEEYCKQLAPNTTQNFTITYTATLNKDAVLGQSGNTNDVFVTYRNTGDVVDRGTEHKSTTKVFTYGIDLLKKGEGVDKLVGVKFTLTDENGKGVNVEKNDSNNFYTPGGSSNTVTTGDDGKIYIRGLKPGTYKLKETKTNNGYVLLKNPVVIVITQTSAETGAATATVGSKDDVTMTADNGSATAIVPLTVVNSKGFDLPVTGGRGIALFTIAGIAIVAAAGSLLFMRKRSK